MRRYKFMEPLSPFGLWHVSGLIFWLCLQDKPLNIHPTQSFGRKSFVLLCLSLVVLEEEYANEEVKEEETTNQNENDEEVHSHQVEFLLRSLTTLCNIKRVYHDIWPTFKTGNNEKSNHGIANIVKVVIVGRPLTSCSQALDLGVKGIWVNGAVDKGSHEKVDSHNCENEINYGNDDQYVENTSD